MSPDEKIVEIRRGLSFYCGRSNRGRLFCWGSVPVLGTMKSVQRDVPTLLPTPALAGFVLTRQHILGWDATGRVVDVTHQSGVWDLARSLPVRRGVRTSSSSAETVQQTVTIEGPLVAGNEACVLLGDGRAFCENRAGDDAFVEVPLPAVQSLGHPPCFVLPGGQPMCWHHLYDVPPFDEPSELGYTLRPVALAPPVVDVEVVAERTANRYRFTFGVCTIGLGGALRCENPRSEQRLSGLLRGRSPRAFVKSHWLEGFHLADGRLLATSSIDNDTAKALVLGLERVGAVQQLATETDSACALDVEGVVRCWGSLQYGVSGSLVTTAREPAAVAATAGTDELTYEDKTYCVRQGSSVECFGTYHGREPRKVPEPVDRIVGGSTLCVHGARSDTWYCRHPSFLVGDSSDQFARVLDQSGVPIRGILGVRVDSGLGIEIRTATQVGGLAYSSRREALRVQWGVSYLPVATSAPPSCTLASPTNVVCQVPDEAPWSLTLPAPADHVTNHCARLAATHEVVCWGNVFEMGVPSKRSEPTPIAPLSL